MLALAFLAHLNAGAGTAKQFSAQARQFLMQHAWPGNVRELKNAVQRAFILADSEINFEASANVMARTAQHAGNGTSVLQFTVGTPLEHIEREMIVATLEHCRGRKRETAELLGVSLKTLYNRLNEYRSSYGATAA